MKQNPDCAVRWVACLVLGGGLTVAAALPAAWQHVQDFQINTPGLLKIALPAETIDAARPGREDLRLYDAAGAEVPFYLAQPKPTPRILQGAKSFQASLRTTSTVITLQTGLQEPVAGVVLETPAASFIKAVRVDGAQDGRNWQELVQGAPIFRQLHASGQLEINLPPGSWPWLRLTIDDQRSAPVPFTGAQVLAAETGIATVDLPTSIAAHEESPGETQLTINLGAANLEVDSLSLETDEPLFTRRVTVSVPLIANDSLRDDVVTEGVVFRSVFSGQPPVTGLSVPVGRQIRSRTLSLLIHNEDSPPLQIKSVHVARRPVYLQFLARSTGKFHLLTGNPVCPAPHYDLATLGANWKTAALTAAPISGLEDNPDYHAPEALPGLEVTGAALDVSAWKYKKSLQLKQSGAQQVELDLEVLAHAQAGFADLRVMRDGRQVPYLLQPTAIRRSLTVAATPANDPKRPGLSRWQIHLPKPNLPLVRLTCQSTSPLFQRTLVLAEEVADERGNLMRHQLGTATWTQTPDHLAREFNLSLDTRPNGDQLRLETENGDNPPIALNNFAAQYPATRIWFKAKLGDQLSLYYGCENAAAPNYDLNLVGADLLGAIPATATLGPEQVGKPPLWAVRRLAGKGGIVFWAALAVVVVGLLFIISFFLPRGELQP